jgi:p-cumate 2,3-dioxygenase subunit beta
MTLANPAKTPSPHSAVGWSTVDDATLRRLERFLTEEADLLDRWQLHEWLDLFTPDGRYLVPATDLPDGDPEQDLFLIQDDRFLLEQRVNSLLTRSAHAEYPHSRTRRLVANVRARPSEGDGLRVRANFAVFRMRNGVMDTYVGEYQHIVVPEGATFRFVERKAVIDLDALRPHGKVSIVL